MHITKKLHTTLLTLCLGSLAAVSCGKSDDKSAQAPEAGNRVPTDTGLDESQGGPNGTKLAALESRFLNFVGDKLSEKAERFAASSVELDQAVEVLCQSGSTKALEEARLSWKKLAGVWEQIELYQLGPLTENAATLRYQITNWPDAVNTCRIDMDVMKAYKSGDVAQLSGRLNRQGLTAAEYLLFEPSLKASCPSSVPVLEEWNQLDDQQKRMGRCLYLKAVSSDLNMRARELFSQWGPVGQNPLSGSFNDSARKDFLQLVFNNLFYANHEMKYLKLVGPAGLDAKYCPSSPTPCPDAAQYPYAKYSIEALGENLNAIFELVSGDDKMPGFKDLLQLEDSEKGSIAAQSVLSTIESMKRLTSKQDKSLVDLLSTASPMECQSLGEDGETDEKAWLCELQAALKKLASEFKDQFSAILKLKAPQVAQGDND